MALPQNENHGLVTGQFLVSVPDSFDADSLPETVPATGKIYFKPSAGFLLNHADDGKTYLTTGTTQTATLDDEGFIINPGTGTRGLSLIATDAPDAEPVGWTYEVLFDLKDAEGKEIKTLPRINIEVASGTEVDLVRAFPVQKSSGVFVTKGEQGDPNTLTIGSVSVAAEASATITGEAPHQILNLKLPRGPKGETGSASTIAGPQGPQGPEGPQGPKGEDSTVEGPAGPVGKAGPVGPRGSKGEKGDRGLAGQAGPTGPRGLTGPTGPKGDVGADSTVPGPRGYEGPQGPKGDKGADSVVPGPQGDRGLQGPKGDTGPKGADSTVAGPVGPMGPKGDTGPKGSDSTVAGPIGPRGARGTTWWLHSRAPSMYDAPQDYMIGDLIIDSTTGDVYTFEGYSNSGGQIFTKYDFSLKGATGPAGPKGADSTVPGPKGATGPAGVAGPAGPQGPEGDAGKQGVAGPVGPQGETGPTGTAGPAGERGEAGPQGAQGIQGEAGPQGIQGEKGDVGPAGPEGPRGDTGAAGQGVNGGRIFVQETAPENPQPNDVWVW